MLAIILLVAVSGNASGELFQADAVNQYVRLNALASKTRYESERAAFLIRGPNGRLTTIAWQAGDTAEASYTGRIPLRLSPSFTHIPWWRPSLRNTTPPKRSGSGLQSS